MTSLKVVFFLFTTWCCTNAQLYADRKYAKDDAFALQKHTARNLIQLFEAIVLDQYSYEVDQLVDAGVTIVTNAWQEIKDEITPFLEISEELQAEAAIIDVDITECIGNSTENLNALADQFLEQIASCVLTKLRVSTIYLQQIVIYTEALFDDVMEFSYQINVCDKEPLLQQVQCFRDITSNITDSTAIFSLEIKYSGALMTSFAEDAVLEMAKCDVVGLGDDDIEEKGDVIMSHVSTCALQKIRSAS